MARVNPNQLYHLLTNLDYPASKKALLTNAVTEKLDSNVIALIGKLPDINYGALDDVSTAIDSLE